MVRTDRRHGANDCPSCGRLIDFDRNGCYRRHFTIEPDGRRRLCRVSGQMRDGVVQLLTIDPAPREGYAHALRLLTMAG